MDYKKLQTYYEKCLLDNPGDPLKQVDWLDEDAANLRYYKFIDFAWGSLSKKEQSVLDFGSGLSEIYGRLAKSMRFAYNGLDISPKMIEAAKQRFPEANLICQDILTQPLSQDFDYVICNGTFTEKRGLNQDEMLRFVINCTEELWKHTKIGLALNVMDFFMIPQGDHRRELFFLTYNEIMYLFVRILKPRRWVIENIGLNDVMVRMYK